MPPVAPIAQQIWDMKYRLKAADGAPINSSSFVENQINMTKGKKTIKAATSTLIGGTGFNVTWRHS